MTTTTSRRVTRSTIMTWLLRAVLVVGLALGARQLWHQETMIRAQGATIAALQRDLAATKASMATVITAQAAAVWDLRQEVTRLQVRPMDRAGLQSGQEAILAAPATTEER